MENLPPAKSLSGHDAYCHVCWEDFYALWVAKEPPPNHECAYGASSARTCPGALGRARTTAFFAKPSNAALLGRRPFSPSEASAGKEPQDEP